jgi:hypothetical protein
MSVYDQINSCCKRIENADTKAEILSEVDKLDNFASYLNDSKAKQLHIYCDNIRKLNVDIKTETINQAHEIRNLFQINSKAAR